MITTFGHNFLSIILVVQKLMMGIFGHLDIIYLQILYYRIRLNEHILKVNFFTQTLLIGIHPQGYQIWSTNLDLGGNLGQVYISLLQGLWLFFELSKHLGVQVQQVQGGIYDSEGKTDHQSEVLVFIILWKWKYLG